MADFMIRFLICNLFISVIVGVLLTAKYLLRNILSSRIQYRIFRSEERRVGKECRIRCSSRWSADH